MTLTLVEQCEVCGDTDGPFETFHGLRMHEDCAPGPWKKDRADFEEFWERFLRWWETPAANRHKRNRRKQ